MNVVDDSTAEPESASEVINRPHLIDPHAYLRPELRVMGERSKVLGKVDTVEHDEAGALTGITVRHGMFGRKTTRVAVGHIKQVNDSSVVVQYNAARFGKLPRIERRTP